MNKENFHSLLFIYDTCLSPWAVIDDSYTIVYIGSTGRIKHVFMYGVMLQTVYTQNLTTCFLLTCFGMWPICK